MSKSISFLLVGLLVLLMFPLWLGIGAGLFGLVIGLLGGMIGLVAGIFGAVIGGIAWFFGAIFHAIFGSHGGFGFHPFHGSGFWVLILVIVIVALSRQSKK